ncbi:MAG: hypothetical protein M3Y48_06590 [Actinomycetota bacterium]|nr:hypothetical protein [Actinomycetota bacterium]
MSAAGRVAAILRVGQNLAIMALHPRVDDVVRTHLDEIDAHAPGLLEGLYLTGSVAMGDFQPGRALSRRGPSGASASDIDFVAVTSRPLTKLDVTAVNRAHAQLARNRWRASFDGLYLTWSDLPRDPADVACSAHTQVIRCGPVASSRPTRSSGTSSPSTAWPCAGPGRRRCESGPTATP